MEEKTISVPMSADENGLFGRECPSCRMYFKIKPVSDLTTTQGICPYCGYTDILGDFLTQDQRAYLESVAAREFLGPLLRDFADDLKRLETPSNGFIQLKISATVPDFPIQFYQEKILETNVTCDTCGLVFSIYGVFSNCPDCGKLNARVIYDKSLDASNGKLVLSGDNTIDEHVRADLIKDALTGTVSAFDALGKALRAKHTAIPAKPNNLFQNFLALDKVLATLTGKNISQFLTPADSDFLFLIFQVRHIYEHNAGVIDSDFVAKLPAYAHQLGRKFPLRKDDVSLFIVLMRQLGDAIYSEFEK
jgi:Zn finger protein HypA/HybF involved in hydrogenase expression